jgi:hypothetical protein
VLTLKLDTKYWPSWELRRDPGKCTWTRHLIGSSSGLQLPAGSAAAAAAAGGGGGGSAAGVGDAAAAVAIVDDEGSAAAAAAGLGMQPMAE